MCYNCAVKACGSSGEWEEALGIVEVPLLIVERTLRLASDVVRATGDYQTRKPTQHTPMLEHCLLRLLLRFLRLQRVALFTFELFAELVLCDAIHTQVRVFFLVICLLDVLFAV